MKKLSVVFAVIAVMTLPGCSMAKEEAKHKESFVTLETITVTAEKFPVLERESSRFVTVISAEELIETGANNLVDALKRKGGFAYKSYGPLGISYGRMNSKLIIRGLGDGELVLINGVPIQGAASHGYDLNTIPIDQIEKVEVIKGAASTLYGADAMTGVINIITKKNVRERYCKAHTEFGSEGYQNHGVSFLSPKLNIGLNYSHLDSIKEIVDPETDRWGIDIESIKIQEIELPAEMKRAIAKQAEAERGRRSVIISSEGELKASENLRQAAENLSKSPASVHLRTLQTIKDIASDPSEKIVLFLPSDLGKITDFIKNKT